MFKARSENGCGEWHFGVWNRGRIWSTGRHTPTKIPRFPRSTHPPPPPEQTSRKTSCTFLLTVLLSLFPLPLVQCRVQNSLYFCVFKNSVRAVKQLKGLEPGRKLGIVAKNFRFHLFTLSITTLNRIWEEKKNCFAVDLCPMLFKTKVF